MSQCCPQVPIIGHLHRNPPAPELLVTNVPVEDVSVRLRHGIM